MSLSAELSTKFRFYPWLLVGGGAIGLLASFMITLEKLRLLMNPAYLPSCSLNPVISCGSVMKTAQASVFGFPNSWLGIIGFTAVLVVGVSLLAGAKFRTWYWRLFNIGTLLGAGFVHWLMAQSIFVIHALCPWCMVVWAVTIPIFWYTTTVNLAHGRLGLPPRLNQIGVAIGAYQNLILVGWFMVATAVILSQFWYYFRTLV